MRISGPFKKRMPILYVQPRKLKGRVLGPKMSQPSTLTNSNSNFNPETKETLNVQVDSKIEIRRYFRHRNAKSLTDDLTL